MKTTSKTHTFEWKVFEPGDRVTPTSRRSALDQEAVYIVTEFHDPLIPYEMDGTVFIEGRKFGYSAKYLRLVEGD